MSDFGHSNRELLEELKSLKSRMVRLGQLGNPDVASSFAGGEEAGKAAILETALDSIISISQDGMITEFNPAAERMFGFRRAEALNRKLADLIVPDRYREAHAQGMAHFLATGIGPVLRRRIEITALRANGEEFPIELAIVPYRIADYWMFTAYIRDLTERKAMERLLEVQYTVSRVLAEVSTLEEATPKILQAMCDSLGWDLGQLWRVDAKTGVLRFLAACRGPATFVDHCRALTFPRDESLPGRVWSHRRPTWIPDISRDENFPRVQVALACNLHAAFAVPVFCRDEIFGVMEFFHHEMAEPDENLLSMMAAVGRQFGQFIERKQAEDALRKSETRLAQSQKMEAIGQLAGGIAHDFNNLLTIINGYSEMILAHLDAKDPNRGSIDAIRSAGERAAALTAQLLSFSRKQLVEFKVVDLNEIIMDVQFMLRRLISEDVHLEFLLQPNLGHVKVDPGQIGQVIINLCINARDAMPTGGKLTIETKEVDLDEEFAANNPEVWPGRYVKLAITDTGTGMDEATRARIFDPFF
ncbi:MAG: PAS domain S-box protein, partial [Gemmataceae bacterium]